MLRCGSFIGLSSATALRRAEGSVWRPRRPLSGKDHTFESCRGCGKARAERAGTVAARLIKTGFLERA
jgi:hypothetical protein